MMAWSLAGIGGRPEGSERTKPAIEIEQETDDKIKAEGLLSSLAAEVASEWKP